MKDLSKLAINGGSPVRTRKNPPMFPGGMEMDEREEQAVVDVIRSRRLFRYYGPGCSASRVEEFEKRFAALAGAKYALGTSSCTGALTVALLAAGVQPGDEVIVPAYTFVASAAAVVAANAIPVIAEVDDSLTLDSMDVESNITGKTRAILPVHMRGAPCDMDGIMAVAGRHGLKVIEDAAQACGGTYRGRPLGSIGDAGCFSFQYHKIITCGEGGAIATSDKSLLNRAKALHDCGANWRGDDTVEGEVPPAFPGFNYRMGELNAAVLLVQLDKRDSILSRMRRSVAAIHEAVLEFPAASPRRLNDPAGDTGISYMFTVSDREKAKALAAALKAEGVDAGTMGDHTVPDWHIYRHWAHILERRGNNDAGYPFTLSERRYSPDMCPRTLDLLSRVVHLYISPRFDEQDNAEIAAAVRKVLACLL